MYAQLDTLIFEAINSFNTADDNKTALWAKHEPITGRPSLEPTGIDLREFNITARFRQEFIDLKTVKVSLNNLLDNHTVFRLIWGNGDIEGNFVLTNISRVFEEQDHLGNIYCVGYSISLLEYDVQDATAVIKQRNRSTATAVGSKVPVVVRRKNVQKNERQKMVAIFNKSRKIFNQLMRLTAIPGNASLNAILLTTTGVLGNTLGDLKAITALRGAATDNNGLFDDKVGEALSELDNLKSFIPVVTGNITNFNNSRSSLNTKMNGLMSLGGVFIQNVAARKP